MTSGQINATVLKTTLRRLRESEGAMDERMTDQEIDELEREMSEAFDEPRTAAELADFFARALHRALREIRASRGQSQLDAA